MFKADILATRIKSYVLQADGVLKGAISDPMAKKISKQDIIGAQGVALIQTIVLQMGFLWQETKLDAGIDGYIEIRDPNTGEVTNCIIQVQSKATERKFTSETSTTFSYLCEKRDLEYWLNGNCPVILVCSRPNTGEAYWVSIKEYFDTPSKIQERKVYFDKRKNKLTKKSADKLASLAVPRSAGLYLGTEPRKETIYSDLLEIHYPKDIYVANTIHRKKPEVVTSITSSNPGWKFILKDKSIISFHDLGAAPWTDACEKGTAESFSSDEWALSDDPVRQRHFVELLNSCLNEQLEAKGLRYSKKRDVFFVKPSDDLSPIVYSYKSRHKETKRKLFKAYYKKDDSEKLTGCKHCALKPKFLRFADKWYIQIEPTQYFTFDGNRPSFYADDLLRKHNLREMNYSLHGQVVMWEAYLKDTALPKAGIEFIRFGNTLKFESTYGFNDKAWIADEEPQDAQNLDVSQADEQEDRDED